VLAADLVLDLVQLVAVESADAADHLIDRAAVARPRRKLPLPYLGADRHPVVGDVVGLVDEPRPLAAEAPGGRQCDQGELASDAAKRIGRGLLRDPGDS
jgi:hypothetical protein